jgi:hypothetical protein
LVNLRDLIPWLTHKTENHGENGKRGAPRHLYVGLYDFKVAYGRPFFDCIKEV